MYTIQCMGQGISLKSERNNPCIIQTFKIIYTIIDIHTFTFHAYTLPHTLNCICVGLFRFHT